MRSYFLYMNQSILSNNLPVNNITKKQFLIQSSFKDDYYKLHRNTLQLVVPHEANVFICGQPETSTKTIRGLKTKTERKRKQSRSTVTGIARRRSVAGFHYPLAIKLA